jgi:hypothetical protein
MCVEYTFCASDFFLASSRAFSFTHMQLLQKCDSSSIFQMHDNVYMNCIIIGFIYPLVYGPISR